MLLETINGILAKEHAVGRSELDLSPTGGRAVLLSAACVAQL